MINNQCAIENLIDIRVHLLKFEKKVFEIWNQARREFTFYKNGEQTIFNLYV